MLLNHTLARYCLWKMGKFDPRHVPEKLNTYGRMLLWRKGCKMDTLGITVSENISYLVICFIKLAQR